MRQELDDVHQRLKRLSYFKDLFRIVQHSKHDVALVIFQNYVFGMKVGYSHAVGETMIQCDDTAGSHRLCPVLPRPFAAVYGVLAFPEFA